MPKREDFPIWTRNRAQRHFARGCSRRFVGLILGPPGRRPELPVSEAPPSNVLAFRIPGAAPRLGPAALPGAGLRQA